MLKRLSYPLAWMETLAGEKEEEKLPSSTPQSADSSQHSSVFSKVFSRYELFFKTDSELYMWYSV